MANNPRLIDMTGQRFGRWTVLEKAGNTPRGGAMWQAVCDCGAARAVLGQDLRKGKSVSCGCHKAEVTGRRRRTHGQSGTRLHRIWKNMRKRCLNPKTPGYENYGGRGISICPEWSAFSAFSEWAAGSGYRDDLSIERMNVNGNYEPDNCMWAGAAVQSANRRFVRKAPDGELWWHKARRNGITWSAFTWRVGEGWPMKLAVTLPLGTRRVERDRNDLGQFI